MGGAVPLRLAMESGNMVLLIADGFFEWENQAQEHFGTERLAEVLRKRSDCEPVVIIAELDDAVLSFSQGTPEKDDLTAVLIQVRIGRVCVSSGLSREFSSYLTITG